MTICLLLSPAVAALLTLTPRDRAGPGYRHRVLQWAQPLGRVVSPLDAVLDATGAIGVGTLAAHVRLVRGQP
ncbi:MAG: teicoplanin resistance protein VanZ [Blastococcus sp.]|nr:teicoplanin resistance protein VanZ [Blastococcus sp.]